MACSDEKDEPLPPTPPAPTKGAVAIACEWNAGQEAAADLPATYIICIGEQARSISRDEVSAYPDLLPPGTYPALAYNEPAHIRIENRTALVARTDSGTLRPDPGFLFSAAAEVGVRAGATATLSLAMRQRVRTLSVELAAADGAAVGKVSGLSAVLSGVAPEALLEDGEPRGEAARLVFPLEPARAKATGWRGSARLLGFLPGERAGLTLRIAYADGSLEERTIDVTEQVKDFNGGLDPLTLEGTLAVREAEEGRFAASITDWRRTDEYVDIEHE